MKKIIQNALSRFVLLCTLSLIGLTSYAQFNYVPGTVYTFRTLISSTQAVQMDIVYDGNDNATVTLTQVAPQSGDKRFSHIFLPSSNEYTYDQNTGEIEVTQNNSFYKKIDIVNGTSTDFITGPQLAPECNGCETGSGGCKLLRIQTNNCWQICCEDDDNEGVCTKCREMKWVEVKNGGISTVPILIIRVSGNITIQ